jgi:RNA polymerase sigma-70 factor (ECF subfamily)
MRQLGVYQVQAAIHGLHCDAETDDKTDWPQIAGLYAVLMRMEPSAVIAVNRAVAMSFAGQSDKALNLLSGLEGELQDYQPFFAAKAEILTRLGASEDAQKAYDRAISLSQVDAERWFLLEQKEKAQ